MNRSLRSDADNLNARNLKTVVLRQLDRKDEAHAWLDAGARSTRSFRPVACDRDATADGQQQSSIWSSTSCVVACSTKFCRYSPCTGRDGTERNPAQLRACLRSGAAWLQQERSAAYHEAAFANPDYVFPSRLEEIVLSRTPSERIPLTRARRTTLAICSTIAGATTKQSRCGSAPWNSIPISRRHGEISALPITMCCVTLIAHSMRLKRHAPCRLTMRASSTNTTS